MRRTRLALIVGSSCAALGTLAVSALLSKPTPVALLKVVDATGKPVTGAVIKPDGLRAKNNGSHYGWGDRQGVKPLAATTGKDGYARVPYPFYVTERLETSEISFSVDHPEFCPDRPFATVDPSPPTNAKCKERVKYWWSRLLARQLTARPKPIVLKRGGITIIGASPEAAAAGLTNVQPQMCALIGPRRNFWQPLSSNVFVSKRVEPGTNLIRMIGFSKTNVYFSDGAEFIAVSSQTNRFELTPKPGVRLAGRLDDSVPRPVMNGRVLIEVFSPSRSTFPEPLGWRAWRPIAADGSFVFESLPAGDVDLIVLCDGYVSKNDSANVKKTSMRTPQVFTIKAAHEEVIVAMERTATCEITVRNDKGDPLEGARVAFWPNVLWNSRGSTIFAQYLINSEDSFRDNSPPDWNRLWQSQPKLFTARSDAQGIAVVTNLPPSSRIESFNVEHEKFEMPISRSGRSHGERYGHIDVVGSETNSVTVRMQKKGTEFIEHPR